MRQDYIYHVKYHPELSFKHCGSTVTSQFSKYQFESLSNSFAKPTELFSTTINQASDQIVGNTETHSNKFNFTKLMSHENVRKVRRLPRTSRVNEKIIEYCKKFAKDRDLEKFMRLYSPEEEERHRCRHSSYSESTYSSSGSNISDETSTYMTLKRLFKEKNSECKSAEDSNQKAAKTMERCSSAEESSAAASTKPKDKQVIITIAEENKEKGKQQVAVEVEGQHQQANEPLEEPATPHRGVAVQSQQTQTPDSIAKSHKRLEWDSLADIGYNKKSKSTNNLSTIERSVLREFFRANSSSIAHITAAAEEVRKAAKSEGVKKRTRIQAQEDDRHMHLTPLASSTRVEIFIKAPPSTEKEQEKTAKREQLEKCVQTSMTRSYSLGMQTSLQRDQRQDIEIQTLGSEFKRQEVQTSQSAATTSAAGSSMTPSSFEFMRPLDSTTTNTMEGSSINTTPRPQKKLDSQLAGWLKRSRGGAEKPKQPIKKREEFKKKTRQTQKEVVKAAEARETAVATPNLDTGIDLICKLFDTRRLEKSEKKKLVRQMVSVLTKLERDLDAKDKRAAASNGQQSVCSESEQYSQAVARMEETPMTSTQSKKTLQAAAGAKVPVKKSQVTHFFKKSSTEPLILVQTGETPTVSSEEVLDVHVYTRPSSIISVAAATPIEQPKSSSKIKTHEVASLKQPEAAPSAPPSSSNTSGSSGQYNVYSHPSGQTVIANTATDAAKATSTEQINKEPLIAATKLHAKQPQPQRQPAESCLETTGNGRSARTLQKAIIESMKSPLARSSQSKTTATTTPTNTTTDNQPSKDSTEAEPSMNEWLNPLTQSEFEFEMQRQHDKLKAAQQKLRGVEKKRTLQIEDSAERQTQLQWIEAEIKRLSGLKKLLSKQQCATKNTSNETDATQAEQIYDTVYSSNTPQELEECEGEQQLQLQQEEQQRCLSVQTASTGESANAVQIIIEESSENMVCAESKSKTRRLRSKETRVGYDRAGNSTLLGEGPTEENTRYCRVKETVTTQELPLKEAVEAKVLYIAPVTQRSKMDTPSDSQGSQSVASLVQERKQEFLEHYRNKRKTTRTKPSETRSMPHVAATCPCGCCHAGPAMHICTYPPRFMHPPTFAIPSHWLPPRQAPTTKSAISQQQSRTQATGTTTTTTSYSSQNQSGTTTSSSVLQQSSEVSVPMGSAATESSLTTTHHYDDVAATVAAVGVPKSSAKTQTKTVPTTRRFKTKAKAKPEKISYFISFNKKGRPVQREKQDATKEQQEEEGEVAPTPHIQDKPTLTLQERLQRNKPEFIRHAQQRQKVIDKIHTLRQERGEKLREMVDQTSFQSLDRKLRKLPPPPIKQSRILSSKEMKEITNKRYATLPEVVDRKQRELEERQRRNNRLMRDIFNRRLQKRVRQGKLSLNHSRTVL